MKPKASRRSQASESESSWETSRPENSYAPAVGRSRQPMMFISVLLPEPDWPISATNSPG